MIYAVEPIIVETEGLGLIYIKNRTAAVHEIADKLLKNKPVDTRQFFINFIKQVSYNPQDKEQSLDTSKLTNNDHDLIIKDYLKKGLDHNKDILSKEDLYKTFYNSIETDVDKNNRQLEKFSSIFKKSYGSLNLPKSTIKDLGLNQLNISSSNQLIESLKHNSLSKLKRELEASSISKLQRESQTNSIHKSQVPNNSTNNFNPLPIISPTSPIIETNEILSSISGLISAQEAHAELLNKKTEILITHSISSSQKANNSLKIALVGIILSSLLSAYSIINSNKSSIENTSLLQKLVAIQSSGSDNQVKILSELKNIGDLSIGIKNNVKIINLLETNLNQNQQAINLLTRITYDIKKSQKQLLEKSRAEIR